MKFINTLKDIGFSENEAKIYLVLLEIGKATAYKISKQAGFKKGTVYGILDNLSQKNFVIKIPAITSTFYKPRSPKEVLALSEEKIKNAKEDINALEKISDKNHFSSNVYYFDGLEEIKKMYKNIIKENKNKEFISFTSHSKNTSKELMGYWDKFNNERVKRKISAKAITPKEGFSDKWTKNQKKYLLKIKFLENKFYDSDISIDIYDRFVQIVSYRYLQGILIDNPDIVKAMKQIFELVWRKY
jgi:sugar-specific transcriptional regulator TrmB